MIRPSAFALVALGALCGCSNADIPAPLRSQSQGDPQTVAACRQRANQVYDQQNRGAIYSQGPQANMPFSANYTPDNPTRGLSAQFGYDRMVNDCIRNTGTETTRTPDNAGAAAAASTARPATSGHTAPPPPPPARP
jgi:hypothetical protein